jgi:hypothetical protein
LHICVDIPKIHWIIYFNWANWGLGYSSVVFLPSMCKALGFLYLMILLHWFSSFLVWFWLTLAINILIHEFAPIFQPLFPLLPDFFFLIQIAKRNSALNLFTSVHFMLCGLPLSQVPPQIKLDVLKRVKTHRSKPVYPQKTGERGGRHYNGQLECISTLNFHTSISFFICI